MIRTISSGFPTLLIAMALVGCDNHKVLLPSQGEPSYSTCLERGVAGGGRLSAADIRSLCAEAASVINTSYEIKEGELVPSNDFTRCVEKEKSTLEEKGVLQASRLAKLSCKYPEVE